MQEPDLLMSLTSAVALAAFYVVTSLKTTLRMRSEKRSRRGTERSGDDETVHQGRNVGNNER